MVELVVVLSVDDGVSVVFVVLVVDSTLKWNTSPEHRVYATTALKNPGNTRQSDADFDDVQLATSSELSE